MAGLDGCRAGWVLATAPLDAAVGGGGGHHGTPPRTPMEIDVRVIPDLSPLVATVGTGAGAIVAAAIDIPIGLAASEPRACDAAARRMLGPRRSSVFPAPVRSVLAAGSYEEACARSRQARGKGISMQLFNILPKIREADAAMAATPGLQDHVFEMCPELSLAVMAGSPMAHPKRTIPGRAERVDALRAVFGDVAALTSRPPVGAAADDVLDALAGLWTAGRVAAGVALRLGGADPDETGLRMEVVA